MDFLYVDQGAGVVRPIWHHANHDQPDHCGTPEAQAEDSARGASTGANSTRSQRQSSQRLVGAS